MKETTFKIQGNKSKTHTHSDRRKARMPVGQFKGVVVAPARATAQWTNTSNMCWSLCGRARARPQHLGVVLRVFLLFCGAQKPSNQKRMPAGIVRAARATRLAGFSCLGVSTPRGTRRSLVAGASRRHRRLGQSSPHLARTFF